MNYAAILKFRNEMNPFAQMLHIDATDLSEGYARAEMPVTEELYNPQGAVHGGVLYTLSDIAGGNAAASHGDSGVAEERAVAGSAIRHSCSR